MESSFAWRYANAREGKLQFQLRQDKIAKQEDDLHAWAKTNRGIFTRPNRATLERMKEVMTKFPNFAAIGGTMNRADPWLIAEALVSRRIVVTYESPSQQPPKPTKPPKIPDVCNAMSMPWVTPDEFLRRLGLRA